MAASDDGVAVLIRPIPHLHGYRLRRKVVDGRRRRKREVRSGGWNGIGGAKMNGSDTMGRV